jgi:hypothetical protein
MKPLLLTFLFIACCAIGNGQTIYYYDGSGALSTTSNWFTNRAGTGSSPSNFTSANQHFHIQTGQNAVNSASWSISGSSTKLLIENNASLTTSTSISLGSGTTFRIDDGGTYIHNNSNATAIMGGNESFGIGSTFRINNWSSSTPVTSNITASVAGFDGNNYYYGNLEINWAAGTTWQQGWTSAAAVFLTAGNFTVTSTFTGTFRFTGTGGVTSPDVYLAGNFTWNSTGTCDFTGKNAPSYLNVNGDVKQTDGTFTISAAVPSASAAGFIYTYGSDTADWTFSGGTRDIIGYRIVLQGSATAKTVNLKSNFNMASVASGYILTNMVQVNSGCTLDAGTYVMSITAGSTAVNVYGTIRTANVNGLVGSTSTTLSNSPSVVWGVGTDCTAEYYATGSQTVSAVSIYENVRIMNSGTKTLAGNANVFKIFYFDAAGNYLNVGNNTLTIESTGVINGAGSTSYFITGAGTTAGGGGRLRQNSFSAARAFPVGNSSYYLPVTITPSGSSSFAVNAFNTTGMDGIVQSSCIKPWPEKTFIADAMWNVDRIAGTVSATVRFDWSSNSIEGAYFNTRPDNEIAVWRRTTDTIWTPAATGYGPNSNSSNYATAINIASADFNTQFLAAWMQQILPLKIYSFTGRQQGASNLLQWRLGSHAGLQYTIVERSGDGRQFRNIGTIDNNNNNHYLFEDAGATHHNWYYRFRLVMVDGSTQYSNIIKLQATVKEPGLSSNAASQQLVLQRAEAGGKAWIFDLQGRLLMPLRLQQGDNHISIETLTTGCYVLRYEAAGGRKTFPFIKQ